MSVDTASLKKLIDYLLDNGVHGVWAAGTTGEFASLSPKDQLTVIETVVDQVAGRVPVIANISGPSTDLSLDMAIAAQHLGLDGIAATPPYYYPHSQDELISHYRYLHDKVELPLWIYHIPRTVKTAVMPETITTLASEGSVVGIKDSSGSGELLAELNVICEIKDIRLFKFLGTIFRITTATALGTHGVIPAIGNLVPKIASTAWKSGKSGDHNTSKQLNSKLFQATKIRNLSKGGGFDAANLASMKAALKMMGIIEHDLMSRPLRRLTDEEKQGIPEILKELNLLD